MTPRESLETRHLRMSGFSCAVSSAQRCEDAEVRKVEVQLEGAVISRRGAKSQRVISSFSSQSPGIQNVWNSASDQPTSIRPGCSLRISASSRQTILQSLTKPLPAADSRLTLRGAAGIL